MIVVYLDQLSGVAHTPKLEKSPEIDKKSKNGKKEWKKTKLG